MAGFPVSLMQTRAGRLPADAFALTYRAQEGKRYGLSHRRCAVVTRVGTQETLSGNTSSHSPQLEQLRPGFDSSDVSHLKVVLNGSGPCAASQRHIRTEQKRRDRINEG